MPRDPVCGQYVEETTPFKHEMEGDIRYFCSEECMEEYEYELEEELVEPQSRLRQEED